MHRGNRARCIGGYAANGRIHGAPGEDAADAAYSAWLADKRAGLSTILIASDNTTVTELNTRAQADLVASGDVDIETTVTLRGEATAGAGDLVLARRNDRSLRDETGAFVANGTRLTLTRINPNGSVTARNENTGGVVTLDPDYLASSTELGYATTAHRSQGATMDSAHAVTSAGLSRELFYVAMTRGRQANHAYVDFGVDHEAHSPEEWELLTETPPAERPVTVLEGVLKRESAEHTAHVVRDAQQAWATDLGRMVHELDYLTLNWRLFMPEAWDDTCAETNEAAELAAARRRKAKIPDTVRHRPKWELALEMIDELAVWGQAPPLLAADAGYGESTGFRLGLTARAIPYVVAVKSSTSAHRQDAVPELSQYTGRGRPPRTRRYQQDPSQVKDLVTELDTDAFTEVTWRQGTKAGPGNPEALMRSRFTALRVRPANRSIPRAEDGALPVEWLLAEWPDTAAEPTDYWLATLAEDTPLAELVRMAKIRWRIEHDYRELKHGLGLDHFEGRSWLGWHHHATLVTAAHLFITTLRLAADPKAAGAA